MKLFGTDGIRGQMNVEPMTPEVILAVGKALGCLIRKKDAQIEKHNVVIGKDTRLSGYMFESALQAGLTSMGIDVKMMGPMPTPAVAYITEGMRADAGIMISASHNPYQDNGIKIFMQNGQKLSNEEEATIQAWVENPSSMQVHQPAPEQVGRAQRMHDASGRYISHIKQHFLRGKRLTNMHIVLDCAHGAMYNIAPTVLRELGAKLTLIGVSPNGTNINEEVGALYPQHLAQEVRVQKADLGIAFDGDGDRVVAVDRNGRVYDGDAFLSIFLDASELYPELSKGVVGTVMTNYGLEKKCKDQNIPFYRANVGDRHVVELMRKEKCMLGGEASGHLIHLGKSTTGDGLLSAILLLNVLVSQNKRLEDFEFSFQEYPQGLISLPVVNKPPLQGLSWLQEELRTAKEKLKDQGRTLVRYSGTENKIRLMVEAADQKQMEAVLQSLTKVVQEHLGAKA
jgi:phosphoglucosamine mutase